MKILTKKKCDEILQRICANEIINIECASFDDVEAETQMIKNNAEIAYIVGGIKGMNKVRATIHQRTIKAIEDLEKEIRERVRSYDD